MKSIIKKTVLLTVFLGFIASFNMTLQAQTRYASYTSNSTSSNYAYALAAIKLKMASEGYSLASDDYFTLQRGETKVKTRTFYDDSEYVVMAIPTEAGVQDLDIYVENSYGTTITKDTDDKAISIVGVNLYSNQTLKIKVRNHSSTYGSYGYDCRLLIFYR